MDYNNKIELDFSKIAVYQGFLTDNDDLLKSSSGGAARAFIEILIKRGGVVFGVTYSEDFYSANYCFIENEEEINKIIGSKYIYSNKKLILNKETVTVFEAVAYFLNQNREVLFIGLGCDISAVIKYNEKYNIDTSKLYLIDLICQGPTFPVVEKLYISRLEKRYKSKTVGFSVRYKRLGWFPPYIRVIFENGKEYTESFYGSDFGYAFGKYSRDCCYNCANKGSNHKSDITLGDYWGLEKGKEGYNKNGVSIIFINSQKGKALLSEIDQDRFKYKLADAKEALTHNPMYYKSREKDADLAIFSRNINQYGLHCAVKMDIGGLKYYFIRIKRLIGKRIRYWKNRK